jgi:two-component system response regulator HydG
VTGKKISILVVEDEEPIARLLIHLLADKFECAIAPGADEAISLVASRRFDIVLADIGLPGMSGIELCRRVIDNRPGTLVIMISARAETEMAMEATRAGAFDYVTKPFDLLQVRQAVERAVKVLRTAPEKRTAAGGNESSLS